MNTKLFLLINFLLHLSCGATAHTEAFSYNKQQVETAFQKINEVEHLALKNNFTYTDMQNHFPEQVAEAALADDGKTDGDKNPLPLGIPAGVWGCCLGLIGVIVVCVYTHNDEKESAQAFVGCAIGSICMLLAYWVIHSLGDFNLIGGFSW